MSPAIRQFVFSAWYLFVGVYATVLLMSSFGALRAQPLPPPTIPEISRRLDAMDAQRVDHRLTVIETQIVEIKDKLTDILNNWENKLTTGGTALLILERLAVATILRKKKEGGVS